ncbi:MAG: hypothetical protein EYC68_02600 [Chloroflexota bacterium]|nr:MAG: hypothetical protein EYC68_02600 [Chloroflexota bacterium]
MSKVDREPAPEKESCHRSQLFTVRVWLEDLGNGQSEWRSRVQHIPSGEIRYLNEWSMLLAFILEMLSGDSQPTARPEISVDHT